MKRGTRPMAPQLKDLFKDGMPQVQPGGGFSPEVLPNYAVPTAKQGDLLPSKRLQDDPEAVAYFMFYKNNVGIGHLAPVDGPMLEKLCTYLVLFDRCFEKLCEQPDLVQIGMNGLEMASPRFSMLTKLGDMIRKFSAELSLTPAERGRIVKGGGGAGDSDDAAKLKRRYLGGPQGVIQGGKADGPAAAPLNVGPAPIDVEG